MSRDSFAANAERATEVLVLEGLSGGRVEPAGTTIGRACGKGTRLGHFQIDLDNGKMRGGSDVLVLICSSQSDKRSSFVPSRVRVMVKQGNKGTFKRR